MKNVIVASSDTNSLVEYLSGVGHAVNACYVNDLLIETAKHYGAEVVIYDTNVTEVIEHEKVLKDLAEYRVILLAKREDKIVMYAAGLGNVEIIFSPADPVQILKQLENPLTREEKAEIFKEIPNLQPERIIEIEVEKEIQTVKNSKEGNTRVKAPYEGQRPKFLGLNTIAIAGAGSGAGTSHIALAIASHLAKHNNQVVLAEWPLSNEKEVYSQYKYLSTSSKKKKINGIEIETAKYNNFDIFLDARSFRSIDYIFPFIKDYSYLILDLGEITPEKIAELDRAALAILVVNASSYRIEKFLSLIDDKEMGIHTPNLKRWKIAVNLSTEKDMKWFTNTFKKTIGELYYIPYLTPASIDEEAEVIGNILEAIIPLNSKPKKRPIWRKLIK